MPRSLRFRRESDAIEFERLLFFTDAVFAIAITLLVVEVGLPEIGRGLDRDSPTNLLEAVGDKVPLIVAFFVGCLAIGGYWMANHRFMARLGAIDGRFIFINVLYLAFVAFLPFSVGTLGEYAQNPISVAIFAINMAIVSTFEVVMFWHGAKAKLFTDQMPDDVQRWTILMSLSPVPVFLLSIPVAFIDPWLGVATWACSWPVQAMLNRRKPTDAARYAA